MKQIEIEELIKGGVVKLKDKDLFSVWIRAVCNNMDAVKLRRLADIADRYGRGLILFTTRMLPILPFIHFDDITVVKEALNKADLVLDRCGARVRNSDVCYDANVCERAVLDPLSLGEKLDHFWQTDPGGHKIKTSIAGCERQCTSPRTLADIGFVAREDAGRKGYDVYVGGKLGLDPFVGERVAELLNEDECVTLVRNFTEFIKTNGRPGERSAHLMGRYGKKDMSRALTKGLEIKTAITRKECETKQAFRTDKTKILRIRATNGEVRSEQARKIADVAEKYGLGFVHFSLRGSPEIPGIQESKLAEVMRELKDGGLGFIENGVDNLQSCFGRYCTNGILDAQALLQKTEELIKRLGLNNLSIKISASGCPNNCGISPLSDIGFTGVSDPEVVANKCNGCGICPKACRVKAIQIIDGIAVIDEQKCKYCGQCAPSCPFDAIISKRSGITVLAGGTGPHFKDDDYPVETELAREIMTFGDEKKALLTAENILKLVKAENKNVIALIKDHGFEKFKEEALAGVDRDKERREIWLKRK